MKIKNYRMLTSPSYDFGPHVPIGLLAKCIAADPNATVLINQNNSVIEATRYALRIVYYQLLPDLVQILAENPIEVPQLTKGNLEDHQWHWLVRAKNLNFLRRRKYQNETIVPYAYYIPHQAA